MVSAPHESGLEFYSIVVPDGLCSPRMAQLQPGDALYVEKTPYGFLTLERFAPGGDLWLLASGTGLSAYLSLLRDPATWRAYRRIILVHGVRTAAELAYREEIESWGTRPELAELPAGHAPGAPDHADRRWPAGKAGRAAAGPRTRQDHALRQPRNAGGCPQAAG
ncbi:hypothetical protein G6F59_015724 [Rhizopus arrhizus]|nr:hypothetical protein G6F59_015724 [Rhizopus arrhizus]